MLRNVLFGIVLLVLGVSFYYSEDFQLIAAGVAVLLFGMKFLENGFERIAAGSLYRFIKKVSSSFWLSFLIGILTTAVFQSSSLITVIAISFLSTRLLSLKSGIGIVFGANLGTTSTAWIVAYLGLKLNISALALPMIFFGILLQSRKVTLQRAIGNVLLGLGGFFMGIYLMQMGFEDFQDQAMIISKDTAPAIQLLVSLASGTLLTSVLQSSSATMAIIITALAAGNITFYQSMAMAIGANIGTTVTAIIGSLNARLPGKQLAIGHLIFNLVTGIIALVMLPLFTKLVNEGADLLELSKDNLSLRLALFHTLFNALGILVMLPFINPLVKLLQRVKPKKTKSIGEPKYLTKGLEKFPQAAFVALYEETTSILIQMSNRMKATIREIEHQSKSGILQQFTKKDIPAFSEYYYERIKPVVAEVQVYSARLSDHYKTAQFNITSRLIAEISRDFNHLMKNASNRELMNDEFFYNQYQELLHQIDEVCTLAGSLEDSEKGNFGKTIDRANRKFNHLKNKLIEKTNTALAQQKIDALTGTTLIHNIDYTKRIVNKMCRLTHILTDKDYLQAESELEMLEVNA